MPLVNLNPILKKAQEENYAVGAFNVYNIEDITAVIRAAEELSSPVILMTSSSALSHSGINELASIIINKARFSKVPVCLHLDHAISFETIIKCINSGYNSVMYDGSNLPYEDNVANTREIVKVAHALNITVEAEIGKVGNSEEGEHVIESVLSKPNEVKQFIDDTKIDACAIAIGSVHAMQTQSVNLDFERLKKIKKLVNVPLVLHGSSGVIESELAQLGVNGIQKVNIGTRLKKVFTNTLRRKITNEKEIYNHIHLLESCIEEVKDEVKHIIKLLNCVNKAKEYNDEGE